MAEGILGLGSGTAASLNQDLIDKLKTAETEATVGVIETSIEDIGTENEVFTTISNKIDEVLESIKSFDLFVTGGATAFDQKTATASGDSVTFDAADVSALNTGITTVSVTQLAQKDVYQSSSVSEANKDTPIIGMGELTVNGTTIDTEGLTYEELAEDISAVDGVTASFEQVGSDSYRLVLKSTESGLDNTIDFSVDPSADPLVASAASTALGFDIAANHTLHAQNMLADVDGVTYDQSSNTVLVDGLTITATEIGDSSINITQDDASIETSLNAFIAQYNELVVLVDEEVYSADSSIEDKAALKDIVSQIKDKLFGSYGENSDKSVFNYGLELDLYGVVSLDSEVFNAALEEDPEGMKDIFVGSAEKRGLGTQIKELIDNMGYSDGVIGLYESGLITREEGLNEDLETAQDILDTKYDAMKTQFAAYAAIITLYESSFSGLSQIIDESTASN